jgi:hypothetical protein
MWWWCCGCDTSERISKHQWGWVVEQSLWSVVQHADACKLSRNGFAQCAWLVNRDFDQRLRGTRRLPPPLLPLLQRAH